MAESAAAPAIKTLFSADRIASRVEALAGEIAASGYPDFIIVGILEGSAVFAADLTGALNRRGLRPALDFIHLASYGDGTVSSGRVEIVRDMDSALQDRDVLIVDDIVDSGRTLAFAKSLMTARGARIVRVCVLLDKQVTRAAAISPDFVGFSCPPVFVVGYGMDLAGRYRDLPYIAEMPGRHLAPDA